LGSQENPREKSNENEDPKIDSRLEKKQQKGIQNGKNKEIFHWSQFLHYQSRGSEMKKAKLQFENPPEQIKKPPSQSKCIRDQVLVDYLPLVVFEARRLRARLPPTVDIDDLISSGTLGLMDAVERFDPARDVKFKTYASFRIRGAMLDFLRENDNYPRSVREFAREMNNAVEVFKKSCGRQPSMSELAALLDRTPEELSKRIANLPTGPALELISETGQEVKPLDEFKVPTGNDTLDNRERREALKEAIERNLNEREKTVLQLYFWDELNLKEIARILGVTESRVSQILTQAKRKMKMKLSRNELFGGAA
jgi:RNA polymerase sigma factor for flagellar operon FliA